MATYLELYELRNDSDLQDRITVAVVIAAEGVRTDISPPVNQTAREVWATKVFHNPRLQGFRMLWAVLGSNSGVSVAQITGSTDTVLQNAVESAIDIFANNPEV